ncbi:CMD domain-containing protein [Franconibacter daqui]|uniref:CMD domain-containing protein n=1 Tax=Franconibacter daqui TaxID=2047724 RepID=A0ABV1PM62_9ENTR
MEPRRFSGKSHWYHETQSSRCPADVLPLVPEAAWVDDRLLLDLSLAHSPALAQLEWINEARKLIPLLFPESVAVTRLHTLSSYDRLSTALTVAQVWGVQRLCNHYAALLAPQPGPDSSRESNRRLTQITQFARQLAISPTVIDDAARAQLDEVGLSWFDRVTFTQIIGFIGFQARVVAIFQALQGQPVRWVPGLDMLQDAAPEHFGLSDSHWRADLPPVAISHASESQLKALAACQPHLALRELSHTLVYDAEVLNLLRQLCERLSDGLDDEDRSLVTLLTARINGSAACFNDTLQRWRGEPNLPEAIRNGERALLAWSHNHPRERAIIQAVQQLTRAPDRFSAAQLTPLLDQGYSADAALRLLAWAGLCGWINRLRMGLGSDR